MRPTLNVIWYYDANNEWMNEWMIERRIFAKSRSRETVIIITSLRAPSASFICYSLRCHVVLGSLMTCCCMSFPDPAPTGHVTSSSFEWNQNQGRVSQFLIDEMVDNYRLWTSRIGSTRRKSVPEQDNIRGLSGVERSTLPLPGMHEYGIRAEHYFAERHCLSRNRIRDLENRTLIIISLNTDDEYWW